MSFKNNPVILAGKQFSCKRFFRGWKVERTMNKKHLLFIELNKNTLYLLQSVFSYTISFYPHTSPGIIQSSVMTPLLRIWKTGAQRSSWKVVKSGLIPDS